MSLAAILFSSNALALQTITLKKSIVLNESYPNYFSTNFKINKGRGKDYCIVSMTHQGVTNNSKRSLILDSGTHFDITSVDTKKCLKEDKRTCTVSAKAFNPLYLVEMTLTCKDRGLFAFRMSDKRIQKFTNEYFVIE